MLRRLTVQNFRGLGDFTMDGLGRINLLVGSNNCGKTSVLEAVHILLKRGDPSVLWSTMSRRGEGMESPRTPRAAREMDVSHLFEGHEIDLNSSFHFAGMGELYSPSFQARIVQQGASRQRNLFDVLRERNRSSAEVSETEAMPLGGLVLQLKWRGSAPIDLPLSDAGGLDLDQLYGPGVVQPRRDRDDVQPVEFITTEALSEEETVSRLEEVVLTENEEFLIHALSAIEGRIERIAPLGGRSRSAGIGSRGGVVVKLVGSRRRLPIGSMGDGMWRLLGIALCLVRARGGVLLIDEIDTGLHYTVMDEMWRLIYDAATRFDVQVFAATHSRDCTQSLAAIVPTEDVVQPEITIQRIEQGNPLAVTFSDDEIALAARIGAEVR